MNKKVYGMLVNVMIFCLGITGCSREQRETVIQKEKVKKYIIGISQPTFNHPIRQAHYHAAELWNEKHSNVTFIFMDGQKNAVNQIADIEDLTARQVDLIMVAEHTAGSLNTALKKAKSMCIPILAFDRSLTDNTIATATVKGDDVCMGRLCGEFLVKALNGKGKIVIIQAPEGVIIGEDKRRGLHSVIDKYPDIEICTQQVGNWQRSVSLMVMENILQGFKEIDAVYADNDEMALGALKAIQEAGRAEEIIVMGIDGEKAALKSIIEGGMNFSAKKILEFPIALNIAFDILEGKDFPRLTLLQPVGVSRENVEEHYDPLALF